MHTRESECLGSVLRKVPTSIPERNTLLDFLNCTFIYFYFICGRAMAILDLETKYHNVAGVKKIFFLFF